MKPHAWSKEEVAALKALYATDAGRYVLDVIVFDLCGLQASSLNADPIAMAAREGARMVGGQLHNAIHLPVNQLVAEKPNEPRHPTLTATERANIAAARSYVKR